MPSALPLILGLLFASAAENLRANALPSHYVSEALQKLQHSESNAYFKQSRDSATLAFLSQFHSLPYAYDPAKPAPNSKFFPAFYGYPNVNVRSPYEHPLGAYITSYDSVLQLLKPKGYE